jgi:uncharacterized protein YfaS (alpha-2-macroglobulin family)
MGRALIALRRAERTLGDVQLTSDSAAVLADMQRGVNELLRRQLPTGEFTWFPGSPFSIGPWLTSYALDFMSEAREEGVSVPQEALRRSVRRLSDRIGGDRSWIPDTVSGSPRDRAAARAYVSGARVAMARALRKAESAVPLAERELLSAADRLSWEDRVALIELVNEFDPDSARSMLNEAWKAVSVAGHRIELADSLRGAAPFPSHVRPAARLMSATLKVAPDHPLLGALSETIVQQGAAETEWAWNIFDYGAAIEGLALLARARTEVAGATVQLRVRGRTVLTRTVEPGGAADTTAPLTGLLETRSGDSRRLLLTARLRDASALDAPLYFSVTVKEIALERPVNPDDKGITVERWYERFDDGSPVTEVTEGELVRVHLRVTVPADRQFVAVADMLPAGLEPVDLSLRTSSSLGPFTAPVSDTHPSLARWPAPGPLWQSVLYGSFDGGYWSPWEYREQRDDRVIYYARQLWAGTYSAGYVARATTVGTFVRPPAHAEEMYNPAVQGRSEGGVFVVRKR